MRILVICQYYNPEPFRIADLCEEMVKRGHEVLVVTGVPNYPEGETYSGYERGQNRDETINGVRVHRCWTIPRKTGALRRLLNYYSYVISSSRFVCSKACKSQDGVLFDVVFVNQLSPVMMSEAAIKYKKKYGVPLVMYCLDLWPESLIAGGVKRGSFIYRAFYGISRRIYRSMDRVLVTSRLFRDFLSVEFGIEDEKIDYLPQYAEGVFEEIRQKEEDDTLDLMFAGNIGAIQSMETILSAAELLSDKPVRFHIVGGGTDLERLERIAGEKELQNVIFYGRQPLKKMPEYYEKADAMLVTLKADPVLSLTLPGKVQSYLAVGKPIIGAIDGETAELIRQAQCGFCGKAEDAEELAQNIVRFMKTEDKGLMGKNARAFYEEQFEKRKFMDRLELALRRSFIDFDTI